MTDNEIIKALECCNGDLDCCKECPAKENNVECGDVLKNNALKLINRQKAEIEMLKSRRNFLEIEYKNQNNLFLERVEGAKSEAIREFAEKLKQQAFECDIYLRFGKEHFAKAVAVVDIDRIVDEMTEGKNG